MSAPSVFDAIIPLPDPSLTARAKTLLGFEACYVRVRLQMRLLVLRSDLPAWNSKYHDGQLALVDLVKDRYSLAIFHGDAGTGKTTHAECIANRMAIDAGATDVPLFVLNVRHREPGDPGELGVLLGHAFEEIAAAASGGRRTAFLVDEGDELGLLPGTKQPLNAEAANALLRGIDHVRKYEGRVAVFFCTNRLSLADPSLVRRAAITEAFTRPTAKERRALFDMDLAALRLSMPDMRSLVEATQGPEGQPVWTYADIRDRLYPAALARAFPDGPLTLQHLLDCANEITPSP